MVLTLGSTAEVLRRKEAIIKMFSYNRKKMIKVILMNLNEYLGVAKGKKLSVYEGGTVVSC